MVSSQFPFQPQVCPNSETGFTMCADPGDIPQSDPQTASALPGHGNKLLQCAAG